MENERGKIHSPARARQLRDFSGLLIGTITPTDIDGLIEYHNIAYIIIEAKHRDKEMDYGQNLAFERLCDDLEKSGKKTILIIARHDVDDPNIDIDMANTKVVKFRRDNSWLGLGNDSTLTTIQLIRSFIENIRSKEVQW